MKRLAVLTAMLGAVALAALALAGLSSASRLSPTAGSPYGGVFEATIKGFKGASAQLNGKWLLSFAPNGAYAVAKEPSKTLLIGGTSTITGAKIVFADKTGPLACKGTQSRGTYTWALSGKTLTLKIVKDACTGRPSVLASAVFTKVA